MPRNVPLLGPGLSTEFLELRKLLVRPERAKVPEPSALSAFGRRVAPSRFSARNSSALIAVHGLFHVRVSVG